MSKSVTKGSRDMGCIPKDAHVEVWHSCEQCGAVVPDPPCRECGSQSTRYGDWLQTYSGRMFWPYDVRSDDIVLEDFAVPLSRICRYGGHCQEVYSVADHSVWVMKRVPRDRGPAVRLAALLHDAAEGYINDMVRPVKHSPEMHEYRLVDSRIQDAIYAAFGQEVIEAAAEQEQLIKFLDDGPGKWKLPQGVDAHPDRVVPTVSWRASYEVFSYYVRMLHAQLRGFELEVGGQGVV